MSWTALTRTGTIEQCTARERYAHTLLDGGLRMQGASKPTKSNWFPFKPETLNSKPYTLNSKPLTLERGTESLSQVATYLGLCGKSGTQKPVCSLSQGPIQTIPYRILQDRKNGLHEQSPRFLTVVMEPFFLGGEGGGVHVWSLLGGLGRKRETSHKIMFFPMLQLRRQRS